MLALFPRLAFLAAIPFLLSPLRAESPGNVVPNPGFEAGMEPWQVDNWTKNEVTVGLDPHNSHSGAASLRASLDRVVGQSNLMVALPRLDVRPDEAIEIRFWARGASNGAPLQVLLRKGSAPYTTYFTTETGLTDEWQEYSFRKVLPADMAAADISLRFCLNAVGVFWIDDVSVAELPSVEGGPAPAENPVRNPSFEAGTDGWTAGIREREFGTLREESGASSPSAAGARLETRTDGGAPEGRRYLSCEVPPGSAAVLTSAYFPARYGHRMRLAFSLRSDGKHAFEAGVASDKNGRTAYAMTPQTCSDTWQAFSVPLTFAPAPGGLYTFRLKLDEPGRYDLDAVSVVEEGESPRLYPPSFAIEPAEGAPVAHLYAPGQKAVFRAVAAEAAPGATVPLQVTVFDYLERKAAELRVDVATDRDGYGAASFEVPTQACGGFRIEARRADAPALLAEQLYSVLPPLPPPAERPDSYFGGHLDLTPYGLEIARKGGFRWLRLYPPLATLWMAAEPEPGKWTFRTAKMEAARAQGFRLLGVLATAPNFAADLDPNDHVVPRWLSSYPPADMAAWKEYVARCVTAFGPWVDAWEVWNEHDGGYMKVRPGARKEEVYDRLLHAAREAVDGLGKPAFLLGPGVTNVNASLGWQALDRGAGCLDAFSFHFYSLGSGGDSPNDRFVVPLIAKYAGYRNRAGTPMPLWITEAGTYLNGSRSWLATYRIPPSSAATPPQAAAAMVRGDLFFKALGVRRCFDYQAGASASGRRIHEDITCEFIDATGIPGPGLAAHAAMVALTEDAAPAGFETREVEGSRVRIARFASSSGKVDVYWAAPPLPLARAAALRPGDAVRDMMGNPVDPVQAQAGEFPLYVLTATAPAK